MAKHFVRFQYKNKIDWGMVAGENIFPLQIGDLSTKDLLVGLQKKKSNLQQTFHHRKRFPKTKLRFCHQSRLPAK